MLDGISRARAIIEPALTGKTPLHLYRDDQLKEIKRKVLQSTKNVMKFEPELLQSVILPAPKEPNSFYVLTCVPATQVEEYDVFRVIPIPLFHGKESFEPKIAHEYIAVSKGLSKVVPIDDYHLCKTDYCPAPTFQYDLKNLPCGATQFFWKKGDSVHLNPPVTVPSGGKIDPSRILSNLPPPRSC